MVSIVIPALNEESKLEASVQTVIDAGKAAGELPIEIILVNDGSTDRTGEICDRLAREFSFISAIHHPTTMGQGAAILTAVAAAKYEQLTMVPGDNAVAGYTLSNLFLNRTKADYVLAVIFNTEFRSKLRIFLSAVYSLIFTTTFDLPIKYINAPALWPVSRLRQMGLHGRRYSLHAEINVKLLRQTITFIEIDGYMNPTSSTSSALRLTNALEAFIMYLRIFIEVYFTKRVKYSARATRVLPPGVVDRSETVDRVRGYGASGT